MNLPYTLSRFQGTATQLSANRFSIVSVPDGWLSLGVSAALSADGVPEGQKFEFLVIYNDQTRPELRGDFMVMTGDYSNLNGVDILDNCEVLFSSVAGGGVVDFDEGQGNLRIVGVASHQHFNAIRERANDVRLLAEARTFSNVFAPYIANSGTQLENAAQNSFVLTPIHQESRLIVDWFAEATTRRTASGQSFRSGIQMTYVNDASVDINQGEFIIYGGQTFPDDANMGLSYSLSSTFELAASQKNSNGDWEIVPKIRAVDTETVAEMQSLRLHYREIL